ncbi:MAG: hypothetical protein RR998_08015 [Oscillospiraceae bacterium]
MKSIREQSIHELGQYFEQSIISHKSDAEVVTIVENAIKYNMAGIFCREHQIDLIKPMLQGTGLFLGAGFSFPFGQESPAVKAFAAEKLCERGVKTIDFVMDFGALIEGRYSYVEDAAALVRKAAPDAELRMIIECCYLTDEQIDIACRIAAENKLDYIKSSTGQVQGPSFSQMVRIAKNTHEAGMKAKVAGIKFPHAQNAMVTLLAGIDRIGTQQAVTILDGFSELREHGIF